MLVEVRHCRDLNIPPVQNDAAQASARGQQQSLSEPFAQARYAGSRAHWLIAPLPSDLANTA